VVVDCQTNKPHSSSIRNFFRSFKEADTRGKAILKLKVRSRVVDCWDMDRSDASRIGQRPTISKTLTRDCITTFATLCLCRTTLAEKECSTSMPMCVSRIDRNREISSYPAVPSWTDKAGHRTENVQRLRGCRVDWRLRLVSSPFPFISRTVCVASRGSKLRRAEPDFTWTSPTRST
jgi:hypothetical protein